MQNALEVTEVVAARLPTQHGEFKLHLYANSADSKQHLALTLGEVQGRQRLLVRVHSECFTGDVLGSKRCDCGEQLENSLKMIAEAGEGVLVYMRQEGRGIGLLDKLRAYNLQDKGFDTVDANLLLGHQPDDRDYTLAAAILRDLGVTSIRLLTNNPAKMVELQQLGLEVVERVQLRSTVNPENERYLHTKADRMHHLLDLPPVPAKPSNNGAP